MMENLNEKSGCVLLKKKEYENLVKKAESIKPDYIEIIASDYRGGIFHYYPDIKSSINLGGAIASQIKRIFESHSSKCREKWIENKMELKKDVTISIARELGEMNYFQLKRWIKENK